MKSEDTERHGILNVPFELKAVETDTKSKHGRRFVRGFASTKDLDRGDEIVDPAAFIGTKDQFMKNPVVLFNHDIDKPVGKITVFEIQEKGLFVEAEFVAGVPDAENVWKLIDSGVLRSFSIGYRPKLIEFNTEDDTMTIKDLELFEISVVTVPMNAEALFSVGKGGKINDIKIITPDGEKLSYAEVLKRLNMEKEDNFVKDLTEPDSWKPVVVEKDGTCVICDNKSAEPVFEFAVSPTGKTLDLCKAHFNLADPGEKATEPVITDGETPVTTEVMEEMLNRTLTDCITLEKAISDKDIRIKELEDALETIKDDALNSDLLATIEQLKQLYL